MSIDDPCIEIYRESGLWVCVTDETGGSIRTQSVEANLLFAILEKFEEIRFHLVDTQAPKSIGVTDRLPE